MTKSSSSKINNYLQENCVTQLPLEGFVRLSQIIGNPNTTPPTPAIIPVSKSTIWESVKNGSFPSPIKLSPKITVWRVSDIRSYINNLTKNETKG